MCIADASVLVSALGDFHSVLVREVQVSRLEFQAKEDGMVAEEPELRPGELRGEEEILLVKADLRPPGEVVILAEGANVPAALILGGLVVVVSGVLGTFFRVLPEGLQLCTDVADREGGAVAVKTHGEIDGKGVAKKLCGVLDDERC